MHDAYQDITRADEATFDLSGNGKNAVSLGDATKAIRPQLRFREFKRTKDKSGSASLLPVNHYYTHLDENGVKQVPEKKDLSGSLLGSLSNFHTLTSSPHGGIFPWFMELLREIQDLIWTQVAGSTSWQTKAHWNSLEPKGGRSAIDMEIGLRRGDIQRMWASPLFLVCKRSRALAIRLWGGTPTRHAIPFNPAADVLEVNLRTPPFVYSPPGQAQAGAGWYMIPPPPQCHLCGNRRLRDAKRGDQLMDIPLTFVDSDNYLGMHGLSDHRASSLFLSRVRKVRVYIPRSNDEGDAANHHPEGWTRYRKVNWYDQVLGHLFLYFPSLETLEISVEKRWDDTVGKCFAFSGQGTGNITQDWDVYDFRALDSSRHWRDCRQTLFSKEKKRS